MIKQQKQEKADIYKGLNDLLFSDNIGKKISPKKSKSVYKLLKDNGATDESINQYLVL